MKEKNKKILKGLGVGALALVGMVGLTGCANISKNDYSRIMDSVEITEHTLSGEEASYVFSKAMAKVLYTESDFWNNMYVESVGELYDNENKLKYSEVNKYYSLKHDNNYVFMHKTLGETDTYDSNDYYVRYTDYSQDSYKLTTFSKNQQHTYKKTEENPAYFDACIDSGMFMSLGLGEGEGSNFEFYKATDIAGGRKNDAGNYVVTMINYWYGIETTASQTATTQIEYEIDSNFNILSINIKEEFTEDGGGRVDVKIKFIYGKISYTDINDEMNIILEVPEST